MQSPEVSQSNYGKDLVYALTKWSDDIVEWLCIKVGRGQGDGDIGTRVWGLGT